MVCSLGQIRVTPKLTPCSRSAWPGCSAPTSATCSKTSCRHPTTSTPGTNQATPPRHPKSRRTRNCNNTNAISAFSAPPFLATTTTCPPPLHLLPPFYLASLHPLLKLRAYISGSHTDMLNMKMKDFDVFLGPRGRKVIDLSKRGYGPLSTDVKLQSSPFMTVVVPKKCLY